MPFPLLGMALIGGGLGAVKHYAVDKPQADRSRRASAVQTQYSPWTGMGKGRDVEEPNALGSIIQGGLTGASLGQNIAATDASTNAMKAYTQAMGGATPATVGSVMPPPGMGSPLPAPTGVNAWKTPLEPIGPQWPGTYGGEEEILYPNNPTGFRDLDPDSQGVQWRMRQNQKSPSRW